MNNIEFKEIKIKLPELRVWFGDREIYLSLSEWRVLLTLLSDPRGRFSTEELVARLDLPRAQSLHVLIAHLRKKLNRKYIVTTRWGYAFAHGVDQPESHTCAGTQCRCSQKESNS